MNLTTNNRKVFWIILFGCAFSLLLLFPTMSVNTVSGPALTFYAFSNNDCLSCTERLKVLETTYPKGVFIIYELREGEHLARFRRLIDVLDGEILPIPSVGVFSNTTLLAIAGGSLSVDDWRRLVEDGRKGVQLYIEDSEGKEVTNKTIFLQEKINLLCDLFTRADIENNSSEKMSLFPLILTAAVVDSFNPCEFNVLFVLLTLVLSSIGKKAILRIGLAFTSAIFLTYFLIGLGLVRFFVNLPQAKYIIIVFTFVMGGLELIEFIGIERKHIPNAFTRRIYPLLKQALNPKTAFIGGVLTALLLLPCTSAPYFIVLSTLSAEATLTEGLLLLLLYHFIIIVPFLAIILAVHTLSTSTLGLKKWLQTKKKWMHLLTGAVMILLGFLLLRP
jgi:cytochrome c biogenesis protein CcdA